MTQSAIARPLGVTQGNVSFYEKGQTVPPAVAGKLIELARDHGFALTYDHIYGGALLPELIGTEGAPDVPALEVRNAA